ncbi:Polysaccharide deacetylase [Sphingomonas guangdongensis]|uniref:Chitooligosaccharide deacetylase n=1 Tax=Sphingomonas guangdongensis TaxID=1141890 RepID=A0A285QZV1_9SPHN|nr:polysaccharide deacetylase family protein [Sphingomonas guangdongensis]SOB87423.1 Polysaccharide deacetylase [Sphingomonas guangdongensis]
MRWLLALLALLSVPAAAQKRIALTFDDVPRGRGAFLSPDERTRLLIAGLRRAGVRQAAFFVNSGKMTDPAADQRRINSYAAAGHVLANHSATHPALSDVTPQAYLADIDRAELWLRTQKGHRAWFRYPYLNEGRKDKAKRDAVRAGLAARGLRNGYVTADGYDWHLEALAVKAVADGKSIDRAALRNLYVETQVGAAEFADALARKATGGSPAHVLLLHETDLAALYIGDLVAALKSKGWQIVTADAAYADPIAEEATRYDTPSAQGTLTEMLAWAKGLPAPRWYERNDEALLTRLFDDRVLHAPTPTTSAKP